MPRSKASWYLTATASISSSLICPGFGTRPCGRMERAGRMSPPEWSCLVARLRFSAPGSVVAAATTVNEVESSLSQTMKALNWRFGVPRIRIARWPSSTSGAGSRPSTSLDPTPKSGANKRHDQRAQYHSCGGFGSSSRIAARPTTNSIAASSIDAASCETVQPSATRTETTARFYDGSDRMLYQ